MCRQRTERHRGDIDRGLGLECFASVVAFTEHFAHRQHVGHVLGGRIVGKRCVAEHDVTRFGEVVVGTEPEVGVLLFRRGIDETSLITAEGQLFVVVSDDVLAQFRAHLLNEVAKVSDYGEVAQDRMFALGNVVNRNDAEEHPQPNKHPQPPRHREIVGSRRE